MSSWFVELEGKLKEFVSECVERNRLFSEADEVLKSLRKALEEAIMSVWDAKAVIETIIVDDGEIELVVVFNQYSGTVDVEIYAKGEKVHEETGRLGEGLRVSDSLAILHHFVKEGARNLAEVIDKKIRESKELTEEVKRVLAEVKNALGPVVLAAKT